MMMYNRKYTLDLYWTANFKRFLFLIVVFLLHYLQHVLSGFLSHILLVFPLVCISTARIVWFLSVEKLETLPRCVCVSWLSWLGFFQLVLDCAAVQYWAVETATSVSWFLQPNVLFADLSHTSALCPWAGHTWTHTPATTMFPSQMARSLSLLLCLMPSEHQHGSRWSPECVHGRKHAYKPEIM